MEQIARLSSKKFTPFRVSEKAMAQKLLNAAMLFKGQVSTKTAAVHDVNDILHHDYCCKAYFNKYQAKFTEIIWNLEIKDLAAAKDDTFKVRFLALNLDFSKSAHSLISIRDRLNECSADIVSNRSVKQLIIEMHSDAVCFTYPSNKQKSHSPAALVESMRVSPVQLVATELTQELKEYY